jgi:AraC-like DNA-binding protein
MASPPRARRRAAIVQVRYQPPGGWPLDVEVKEVTVAEGRASLPLTGLPERADFHLLVAVRTGRMRHSIDFTEVEAGGGSLLTVRAGQVHRFDLSSAWKGWLVIFRPEVLRGGQGRHDALLTAALEGMPPHLELLRPEQEAVWETVARMSDDARVSAGLPALAHLLRGQLETLLLRLDAAAGRRAPPELGDAEQQRRLRRFTELLEARFRQEREVAAYARLLRCSERTLTRTTLELRGMSAKAMIDGRVALEARRLLAHTDLPSADIAALLGFDEATNFGKFFRRTTGCTPGAFRRRHRDVGA